MFIRILDNVDSLLARLESFIMASGVILMAINTVVSVISRFAFNHSLAFSEELNSIFILLVTFAGIGYAARHGRHIRMSAIYDAMPYRTRKILMTIITGFTALCLLLLCWFSVVYILNLYSKGRVYPALDIPVYISYLWVPIGFFVTGVQYALTCVKNLHTQTIFLSTNLQESETREVEV